MSLIAFVILTLVCFNFINLQTAEAITRIKDFGLKRINGASNSVIVSQLIGEALIFCIISLFIAAIITGLSEKYLFDLLGKSASSASIITVYSLLIGLLAAFIIAFLSGFVPGMIIKSVSPCNSINKKVHEQVSVKNLRVFFTSLQFCIAIVLIICLFTTHKQVNYLRNKDLGFKKDHIVYVHMEGNLKEKKELLREELVKNPSIINATLASRSPVGIYWNGGGWKWEGKPQDFNPQITFIQTDEHFRKTFEIEMLEGGYFESDKPGVVINESFAKMISPNGKALNKLLIQTDENINVPVIGIIKDIHFKPLNRGISPLMIIPPLGYDEMRYLFLKLSPENMDKTLVYIKKTVNELNPDFPCEYFFLDDDFDRLYKGEERFRNQMGFFSTMAILISCMGLLGILMFIVKQRIKEIGIRKVNGAKISEVMILLNKDFVKWVAIAFVIATPIAYYAMTKWLENFAYKTELSWWIFALSGVLALGIALLTVSWQSWKAATRNPVEALRYE
jgi:putative ABC transport system permease protein